MIQDSYKSNEKANKEQQRTNRWIIAKKTDDDKNEEGVE